MKPADALIADLLMLAKCITKTPQHIDYVHRELVSDLLYKQLHETIQRLSKHVEFND